MYTALYRAERPEVFDEILGQEHIVKILKHQIATNTVSHAYLFCGTRGTGKTTTARILAKAVNCTSEEEIPCGQCDNCLAIKDGSFMDVIEIDAASNNGVENIRELRESVKYPPAVGRKKVYIIDEVHMLSTGAANALLKTLEEPPENVMFILATTDPQKLPQTILSRCMRLDFRRIPEDVIMGQMKKICDNRGVQVSQSALRLLSSNADGSARDGLSILDQCLSAGDKKLDRDDILEFLGTVSEEFFIDLTEKVTLQNVAEALLMLQDALKDGKDVKQLMKDWMSHYRNLLITKYIKNPEDMLNMSTENVEKLRDQSMRIPLDEINNGIITLSRTINDARYSSQPRILMELAIVTIASGPIESQGSMKTVLAEPKQKQVKRAETRQAEAPRMKPDNGGGGPNLQNSDSDVNLDLDMIWSEIFEEGEGLKGSFNIIRTGTTLAGINGNEFKIIAHTTFAEGYVEQNRVALVEMMSKKMGKPMKMVCRLEGHHENEESKAKQYEDAASELERKFGIDVTIK